MNIKHHNFLDKERVCELYSKKDGVPITYVCTSALGAEAQAMDIFYRETPHPNFGNRYFGLYEANNYGGVRGGLMITNADKIEDAEFGMVEGSNGWEYSQHRHDYRDVEGSGCAIDGGRAYFKRAGDLSVPVKYFVVKDGKFVEKENA